MVPHIPSRTWRREKEANKMRKEWGWMDGMGWKGSREGEEEGETGWESIRSFSPLPPVSQCSALQKLPRNSSFPRGLCPRMDWRTRLMCTSGQFSSISWLISDKFLQICLVHHIISSLLHDSGHLSQYSLMLVFHWLPNVAMPSESGARISSLREREREGTTTTTKSCACLLLSVPLSSVPLRTSDRRLEVKHPRSVSHPWEGTCNQPANEKMGAWDCRTLTSRCEAGIKTHNIWAEFTTHN